MYYNFKRSLKLGHIGEEYLLTIFPDWQRTDGRKQDFNLPNGNKAELKSESRTCKQTPNLAIELSSSFGRPGALHNSFKQGTNYFIYLFACKTLFIYDTFKLYYWIKKHKNNYRQVKVSNRTYETTVVLVPRYDLRALQIHPKDV